MAINSKEKIQDAAIELLFLQGKFYSSSYDIADLAGVKRPLVYYYFKSINDLILSIMIKTREERDQLITNILNGDLEFHKKLEVIFEIHQEHTIKYPFRQVYIATHSNIFQNIESFQQTDKNTLQILLELFENEENNKKMKIKDPYQALILLVSFLNYPLLMISSGPQLLKISKDEYIKILNKRKATFLKTILNDN